MTHFLETYNQQPNELTPTQVAKILHCTQLDNEVFRSSLYTESS